MRTGSAKSWRIWGRGGALLLGGAALAACTQPAPVKSDLYVCEAGQNGCPKKAEPAPRKQDPEAPPTRTTKTDEPDATDDEGRPREDEPTKPTPPPPSSVGPECAALSDCCENLRVMGITGSANACLRTVRGNEETTCASEHQTYKTPDDYYEPVCF